MQGSEEIQKVHNAVEQAVYAPATARVSSPETGILGVITGYSPEIASIALGDIGAKLYAFASRVDFEHPDLPSLVGGNLVSGYFPQMASEVLELAKLGVERNLWRALSNLNKASTLEPEGGSTLRLIREQIDDPSVNLLNVRFLKSPEERDAARRQKNLQEIDLSSFCQKGNESWNSQPDSFMNFVRYAEPFKEEIDRCRRLSASYIDLGCPMLGEKIAERISAHEDQVKDRYYEFNRITVTTASVIGAKFHGCSLNLNAYLRTNLIVLPPALAEASRVTHVVGMRPSRSTPVQFLSRYYPAYQFESTMGDRSTKLIKHLDEFPEAGGKPIFDHFRVLFFGPNYLGISSNDYGESQEVRNLFAKLDNQLFRIGVFHPILLGEKDGKAYFIDFLGGLMGWYKIDDANLRELLAKVYREGFYGSIEALDSVVQTAIDEIIREEKADAAIPKEITSSDYGTMPNKLPYEDYYDVNRGVYQGAPGPQVPGEF